MIPERRIQRRVRRPGRSGAICVSRRVFKVEDRSSFIEGWEARDVAIKGICFINVEVASVDFVEAVTAVEVGQRGDARPDPAGGQSCVSALDGRIVGKVDHELIFVSMAKEYVGDDMGRVSIDDLVEEVRGVRQRVGSVPAAKNVADNPNTFSGVFGLLKLVDHEFEHARVVGVG